MEAPAPKRLRLLAEETVSESASSETSGGVSLDERSDIPTPKLTINEDYARTYEYNQQQAERRRLEEKYGHPEIDNRFKQNSESDDQEDTGSSEEEEDDNGSLANGILDEQYTATLNAIKEKNPRVYDKGAAFYTSGAELTGQANASISDEKPMFLRDYHRRNLLHADQDRLSQDEFLSERSGQDHLKNALVQQIHAAGPEGSENNDEEDDLGKGDDLFTVKNTRISLEANPTISVADVEQADKDPDRFLSRFIETRAWVPTERTQSHPFESDDEEDDRKVEEFENAYNMRFENPDGIKEKLVTHARDSALRYSVRSEAKNKRKRARETEKARKDEAKSERLKEKKMLQKFRMEEVEQKLDKIKDAAGLTGLKVDFEDWAQFLTDDWDTAKWESEMQQAFGDEYYAAKEDGFGEDGKGKNSRPRWDSDVEITDIIPGFTSAGDESFSLLEDDYDEDEKGGAGVPKVQNNGEQKREARGQRRKLQQFVNERLDAEVALQGPESGNARKFRYRETSPLNYGLTAQDILMATDGQLNQFAGLKKMATFRDAAKRQKDLKRLGKKARLRQWRKETFGSESSDPKTTYTLQDITEKFQRVQDQESQGSQKNKAAALRGKSVPVVVGSAKKRARKKRVGGDSRSQQA